MIDFFQTKTMTKERLHNTIKRDVKNKTMKSKKREIELTEKGIKKSFLKIFLKYSLAWEEMLEIRVISIPTGGAWLFFSKTSLTGMSLGKAGRQKGQIKVTY